MQKNKVLQKKNKLLRGKCIFLRNKELQNIKIRYLILFYLFNTYFSCSHLIHLQHSIYFAFQSKVSSQIHFPLRFIFLCVWLHGTVYFFWGGGGGGGGGSKKLGRVPRRVEHALVSWLRPSHQNIAMKWNVQKSKAQRENGFASSRIDFCNELYLIIFFKKCFSQYSILFCNLYFVCWTLFSFAYICDIKLTA